MMHKLLLLIFLPFGAGLLALVLPRRLREGMALAAAAADLFIAASLFGKDSACLMPWLGFGIDFSLRVYNFSAFVVFAAAGFAFLVVLYSTSFMRAKPCLGQFYGYVLISLSFVNGALLADNLIVLLFFWEGLLILLFGLIRIGRKEAYPTAIKAFVISGIADLCMMAGIALTWRLAGTLAISKINLSTDGALAGTAFVLLVIGAISKAGAMPFHSWIPDAAEDAPLSFMAFLPASLDKLLGIYFLIRISWDMFKLQEGSFLSIALMSVGALTIVLAVMVALVQKDYKRLLSYHAVSQTGYMIMGIGTCLPAGVIGGIFHMINHATYKSGLFLTAGSVEKQAGTTDLEKLGGLGSRMPVTFICFTVMALSISGCPPFNGFFSKELIYDAALERGLIFYLAAIMGSLLTAVSFLKLGHSAYLGARRSGSADTKEAPAAMLVPMIVTAAACVMLGLGSRFVLERWLAPFLGEAGAWHMPAANIMLIILTIVVLLAALIHHLLRVRATQDALKSADDIYHAPFIRAVYALAEKKYADPYEAGLAAMGLLTRALAWLDRKIDWVYNVAIPGMNNAFCGRLSAVHSGYYAVYIVWALAGSIAAVLFLLK
ncbi:MAG: proton-conducting transporter membrane subunit [Candidatus Omnitrophota bacterium]|nr:proton-conducting transporter membrane subunit [Candidatus Omnitrophota bacterium]